MIHDVFYVSLLEQNTTKKTQVDQINQVLPKLEKNIEFQVGDNKKYKIKAIINIVVYGQQANN